MISKQLLWKTRSVDNVYLSYDQQIKTKNQKIKKNKGQLESFDVLNIFPFSSATKRMGIVVQSRETEQITFFVKGSSIASTAMILF